MNQTEESGGLCLNCYKPWCPNRKRGTEHCDEYPTQPHKITITCPVCGVSARYFSTQKNRHCTNCGAKIDGEEEPRK